MKKALSLFCLAVAASVVLAINPAAFATEPPPDLRTGGKYGYCIGLYRLRIPEGTPYQVGLVPGLYPTSSVKLELPGGPVEYLTGSELGKSSPLRSRGIKRLLRWNHGQVVSFPPSNGSVFSMVYFPNPGWGDTWVEIRLLRGPEDTRPSARADQDRLKRRQQAALDLISPFDRCPIA